MVAAVHPPPPSSYDSWQPGEIPSTIGSSLQSWLRAGHQPRHHQHLRNCKDGTAARSSTPTSDSPSSTSASSYTDQVGLGSGDLAMETLLSSPSVNLSYQGRWDQLAAQAELYLYAAATPYFFNAHLGNVQNPLHNADVTASQRMWQQVTEARARSGRGGGVAAAAAGPADIATSRRYPAEERATIGTATHTDGKVGSLRWVAADPDSKDSLRSSGDRSSATASGWMSWLPGSRSSSTTPAKCLNVLEVGQPDISREQEQREEKIVVLAGYGAGIAFFYQNFAALAARPNSRLYALDWLGMGRSSRPPFHIPATALQADNTRVEAAEGWFIESLEEWRKKAGLEKMTLIGHSLGGYLSVAYALRYPTRVSRLVLISPAGVGASPEQVSKSSQSESPFTRKQTNYLNEATKGNHDADAISVHSHDASHDVEREVLDSQHTAGVPTNQSQEEQDVQNVDKQASGDLSERSALRGNSPDDATITAAAKAPPPPRFSPRTRAVFSWLWEQNYSPFGLLRTSSFLGPWLASRYTARRFATLPDKEKRAIAAYTQAIFLSRGSGEYCLAHLLLPGAWARLPIVSRAQGLRQDLPVSFIYGESDWMDVEAGREVLRQLHSSGHTGGRTFVVPHAGHNVHIDNPRALDRLLRRILDAKADRSSEPIDSLGV